MIDNHAHLDLMKDSLENVISRAKNAGVAEFIVPGICGFPKKLDELIKYNEIKFCWGIYPKYAEIENIFEKELEKLNNSFVKIIAVGECGLDKRFGNIEKQIQLFQKQINLAINLDLPLIIHLVGHWQKAFDLLKKSKIKSGFVLHSWSGSIEMAKEFVKLGGTISLSAGALKSQEKLARIFKEIPNDKIIFETDCPDQKPDFISAEENEPANLPIIIEKILSYKV